MFPKKQEQKLIKVNFLTIIRTVLTVLLLLCNPNQIATLCYLSATVEQDRKYFVLLFCGTENSPTTNVNFYNWS